MQAPFSLVGRFFVVVQQRWLVVFLQLGARKRLEPLYIMLIVDITMHVSGWTDWFGSIITHAHVLLECYKKRFACKRAKSTVKDCT